MSGHYCKFSSCVLDVSYTHNITKVNIQQRILNKLYTFTLFVLVSEELKASSHILLYILCRTIKSRSIIKRLSISIFVG